MDEKLHREKVLCEEICNLRARNGSFELEQRKNKDKFYKFVIETINCFNQVKVNNRVQNNKLSTDFVNKCIKVAKMIEKRQYDSNDFNNLGINFNASNEMQKNAVYCNKFLIPPPGSLPTGAIQCPPANISGLRPQLQQKIFSNNTANNLETNQSPASALPEIEVRRNISQAHMQIQTPETLNKAPIINCVNNTGIPERGNNTGIQQNNALHSLSPYMPSWSQQDNNKHVLINTMGNNTVNPQENQVTKVHNNAANTRILFSPVRVVNENFLKAQEDRIIQPLTHEPSMLQVNTEQEKSLQKKNASTEECPQIYLWHRPQIRDINKAIQINSKLPDTYVPSGPQAYNLQGNTKEKDTPTSQEMNQESSNTTLTDMPKLNKGMLLELPQQMQTERTSANVRNNAYLYNIPNVAQDTVLNDQQIGLSNTHPYIPLQPQDDINSQASTEEFNCVCCQGVDRESIPTPPGMPPQIKVERINSQALQQTQTDENKKNTPNTEHLKNNTSDAQESASNKNDLIIHSFVDTVPFNIQQDNGNQRQKTNNTDTLQASQTNSDMNYNTTAFVRKYNQQPNPANYLPASKEELKTYKKAARENLAIIGRSGMQNNSNVYVNNYQQPENTKIPVKYQKIKKRRSKKEILSEKRRKVAAWLHDHGGSSFTTYQHIMYVQESMPRQQQMQKNEESSEFNTD